MTYQLFPLKGANAIEFGMPISQARSFVNETPKEFRRGHEATPSDFFQSGDFFFYYDDDGYLEAIEFSRGAQVQLAGKNIFDMDFEQCLSFLKILDPETIADDDGAISHHLSLGVWVPFMTADDEGEETDNDEVGQIETVLIGRPGYFDFKRP